ncbi:hypothetical protein BH11BAC2_BH11BAC2_14600 [soil metagenome]
MKRPYKIAVVGPESTGKSVLSAELASYFQCAYVPEVAREYLNTIKRPYVEDDLLAIAKIQVETEDALLSQQQKVLICDTTLLVIRIWSEVKYERCEKWILQEENSREYDFFLLTNIDLPWEDDPQREHPTMREALFSRYYDALLAKDVKFEVVSGMGVQRLNNALKSIQKQIPELFSKLLDF